MKTLRFLPERMAIAVVVFRLICLPLLIFSMVTMTFGQTIINGGPVSGTWTLAGSPYQIFGDIVVPAGQVLTIGPGVTVDYKAEKSFTVLGHLIAEGTAAQMIIFKSSFSGGKWKGMKINNALDTTVLNYCGFQNLVKNNLGEGGGALYSINSLCLIKNSTFSGNMLLDYSSVANGGAVFISGGKTIINNCDFSSNMIQFNSTALTSMTGNGGALCVINGTAEIKNCSFSNNIISTGSNLLTDIFFFPDEEKGVSCNGGAIYAAGNLQIDGNTIVGNFIDIESNILNGSSSTACGGGIFAAGTVSITNNTIQGNHCWTSSWDDGDWAGCSSYSAGGGVHGGTMIKGNFIQGCGCGSYADAYGYWGADANATSNGGGLCAGGLIIENQIINCGCSSYVMAYSPQGVGVGVAISSGGGGYGGQYKNNIIALNGCTSNYQEYASCSCIGGGVTGGTHENSVIYGNELTADMPAIFENSGIHGGNLTNSIVWGNFPDTSQVSGTAIYSCIEGGFPGQGNINSDPQFVAGPMGEYYLSQLAAGQSIQSPCVDAGDPSSPIPEGTTRTDDGPDTGITDMGCHYPQTGWYKLYLQKVSGQVIVWYSPQWPEYDLYFIIPLSCHDQAPLRVELEGEHLLSYRFLHQSDDNILCEARMSLDADSTLLTWNAWVISKRNSYENLPSFVSFPSFSQLPDSVKQWLDYTDCIQNDNPFIEWVSDSVRNGTTNLIHMADHVAQYCSELPDTLAHTPHSYDAFNAISWGNTSAGKAHAGAALFRVQGVPARVLISIPSGDADSTDTHWFIEYYVPDYDWVKIETTQGIHPYSENHESVITHICTPEDEFPVITPNGRETCVFTSDPATGTPEGVYYQSKQLGEWSLSSAMPELAVALADSVYRFYTNLFGINLTPLQQEGLLSAVEFQDLAFAQINDGDVDSLVYYLNEALTVYKNIEQNPEIVVFGEDFENDPAGWTHGGAQDEWEWGIPATQPSITHSGQKCFGLDLDGYYENNTDCWLLSPPVDLDNLSCAYLKCYLWNNAEDNMYTVTPVDPLWLEVSVNGSPNFIPLTTYLGGVNDDPAIPSYGGWIGLVTDLTTYCGMTIQIRFHFTSNASITYPGPSIDDILVWGRPYSPVGIHEQSSMDLAGKIWVYPNPFNDRIIIQILETNTSTGGTVTVYDIHGRKIMQEQRTGMLTEFDLSGLQRGIFLVKIEYNGKVYCKRIIKK